MLTVSATRPHVEQERLWSFVGDRDLTSIAQARPYVGAFFEEATRIAFGATRHQIDSRADYCPDLSVAPRRFIECKAIGKSGAGLVFADRIEKDARLLGEGAELTYLFWRHATEAQLYPTLFGLREGIASRVLDVVAVPFGHLRRAVAKLKRVPLLVCGQENREGYRLPAELLNIWAAHPVSCALPAMTVERCAVASVMLRGPGISDVWPDVTPSEMAAAGELLFELGNQRLEVALLPAPRPQFPGHKVRSVANCNPAWYSDLSQCYDAKRKVPRNRRRHDTDLRRRFVERALERWMHGNRPRFDYDFRVRPIVQQRAAEVDPGW